MISGFLVQKQFFSQLYQVEMSGFLAGLGLLTLQHLIYDISKVFDRVWQAVFFFSKSALKEFQACVLALFRLFSVLYWNFLQEYPMNAGVPQSSIFDSTLILPYINDLPDHSS